MASPPPHDGPIAARLRAETGDLGGQPVLVVSYPLDEVAKDDLPELTPALRDVARLTASGLEPERIAKLRATSPRTVTRQLGQIYRRLHIGSRAELIALVLARATPSDPGGSRAGG